MVVLHTLGECSIRTTRTIIHPNAGTLFTLGAYLIVHRGVRIPRATITALLWPADPDTPAARQRLRSAINKLRDRGLPIHGDGNAELTIWIDKHDATTDDAWLDGEPLERILAHDFSVLPGFVPRGADTLRDWADDLRDTIRRRVVMVLDRHLTLAKASGHWHTMMTLAERMLTLDPHHAQARHAARYARDLLATRPAAPSDPRTAPAESVTLTAARASLPALYYDDPVTIPLGPGLAPTPPTDLHLVGRHRDLLMLSDALANARNGQGGGVYLWGPSGIGKSRITRELEAVARADDPVVLRHELQSYDQLRPWAVFATLAPTFHTLPGAAGCNADTLAVLAHLDTSPPPDETVVRHALFDLMDAVSEEQALVFIIDGVQWADPLSWATLRHLATWASARAILLVLTSTLPWNEPRDGMAVPSILTHALEPLSTDAARQHAINYAALMDRDPDLAQLDWAVRVTDGHPGLLEDAIRYWAITGETYHASPRLRSHLRTRIAELDSATGALLHACVVLERYATIDRLDLMLELPQHAYLDALEALARSRLVSTHHDAAADRRWIAPAHELVTETTRRALGPYGTELLHRRAASILDQELVYPITNDQADVLWACADHWQASGHPSRAVDLGLTYVRRLLTQGLADDATTACERTLRYCTSETLRQRVLASLGLQGAASRSRGGEGESDDDPAASSRGIDCSNSSE